MFKLAVVVALLGSGCSVALQKKPKAVASDCSTANAYWIADAVGVAAGVAALTYGIANPGEQTPAAIAGVGSLGAIVYAASANNGYKWARRCRAGHETAPIALR